MTVFKNNSHSVLIVHTDLGLKVCHQSHNISRQQFPVQYDENKEIAYDFTPPKYIKPEIKKAFTILENMKEEIRTTNPVIKQ